MARRSKKDFIPRVQQFSDYHNHDLNKLSGFEVVFPRGLRSYKERVENSLNLVSLKFSLVRKISSSFFNNFLHVTTIKIMYGLFLFFKGNSFLNICEVFLVYNVF